MPKEETHEEFTRRWTTDARGNRVLRGLTLEETEFHESYLASRRTGERSTWPSGELRKRRARFLELADKHEVSRLEAVVAERRLRVDKPTLN